MNLTYPYDYKRESRMTPTFLVQAAGEMMMPFTEMETRARIVNRERD